MNYIAYIHNTPLKKESIGAKAFSLAELFNHVAIPKGFVITAEAFSVFLKQVKKGNDESRDMTQLLLAQEILNTDVPEDLKNQIIKAIEFLGLTSFSVRSSGVDEDGDKFSFAGQLETSLGVVVKEIFPHIKKSWASLYSAHLVSYASRFTNRNMSLAILVQEMVDSDISGVGFSCHPVTGSRDVVVVESVVGLGEVLVQGAVTPWHYVVQKNDLSVVKKIPGDQEKFLRFSDTEQKICEYDIEYPLENKYDMDATRIEQVTQLVLRVEEFYNTPVDIEWAFAGDTLYLLQARPVTSLLK